MVVIDDACAACPMAHAHMSKIFHSVQERRTGAGCGFLHVAVTFVPLSVHVDVHILYKARVRP